MLAARKRAGLRQIELAVALGERYDHSVVSAVEHNRSSLRIDGLTRAAHALGVSTDYLLGLTDDPTPAAERDPKALPFPGPDDEYESVRRYNAEDLRLAAGVRAFIDREPTPSEIRFRKDWLQTHALAAKNLMLINVIGDSMFPTIEDGDSVLIDESRRVPRSGRVYGLRTLDGPLVKRLLKRQGRWWAGSDNGEYKPRLMRKNDQTLGQVVWWAHTEALEGKEVKP